MIADSLNQPITLDSLTEQLFRLERATPIPQVTDHRIAAGFLLEQYGDRTRRFIKIDRQAGVNIVIEWIRKMSVSRRETISTTQEVVATLLYQDLVEGTPHMGYTDMTRLTLNANGKRKVVREYFSVNPAA